MDDTENLGEFIGTMQGQSITFAGHLFGVIATVLVRAEICTHEELSRLIDGQAGAATDPHIASMLKDFAVAWGEGRGPNLKLVE